MTHAYHEALPGYSEAQILHDHCPECEARASSGDHGIASLDRYSFTRAWRRAKQWQLDGLPDLAQAEAPMLAVMWAIQVQLPVSP